MTKLAPVGLGHIDSALLLMLQDSHKGEDINIVGFHIVFMTSVANLYLHFVGHDLLVHAVRNLDL